MLNDETIATEIVRTLIGSLGIIAAIPITTFIAGLLVEGRAGDAKGWETFRSRSLSRIIVTVAGIITPAGRDDGRLARRAAASAAHVRTRSVPSRSGDPGSHRRRRSPPPDGVGPARRSTSDDVPQLFDPGQPVPITVDGSPAGTSPSCDQSQRRATRQGATCRSRSITSRRGTFPLAAGQWELLLEDGSLVPLVHERRRTP